MSIQQWPTTTLLAQKEVISEGFAEVMLQPSMNSEQAEIKAIELAKINAIENAFGALIMEGNTLYTINKNTGQKTELNQVFNSISETYVNGEWVKNIIAPIIEKAIKNKEVYISAKVKGLVRELKSNPAKFISKPLSCENVSCFTETFNNGQSFYLYFKAPNNGYVTVYADIPGDGTTYRLLPYKHDRNLSCYPVKADQDYIFFSKGSTEGTKDSSVDELIWTLSDKAIETNKLYVFFSPNEIAEKPILKNEQETPSFKNNMELPLSLKSSEFMVWQQKLRKINPDIQLQTIYIAVKP